MLRDRVADIITGTLFVFVGFVACGIAAIRRRSGVRVLVWLGIWSVMYGARPLIDSLADLGILSGPIEVAVPYLDTVIMYLILVVAALAWMQLSRGKLLLFLKAVTIAGIATASAGIVVFVVTGRNDSLILYNQALAACALAVLLIVAAAPKLSSRFLVIPDRGVFLAGTLFFALEALLINILRPMGYPFSAIWDSIGFAALLFSYGYVSVRIIFANERRLHSIENELAIAREIQNSIVPEKSPELRNLCITTAYEPMTYVAGDFFDFIPVDRTRAGILIADVSGHGVPAALIAAMIKVAMQSIFHCAHDPREVLRGLNRALFGLLRNQVVTASYLWMDTESHTALYSAAGHPPLLHFQGNRLERIESNGLLFGVVPDPDYPVRSLPIRAGDRFLLYTDGLIEPENSRGESFGDAKLEQVLRKSRSGSPSELASRLLSEIRLWQGVSAAQQDDITLIIVDVI